MRRPSPPALATLAALAVGACGDGARTAAAPPERVKLIHVADGQLATPRALAEERTVLEVDFALGTAGWRTITSAADPLKPATGVLELTAGREDGRAFLTLAGRRGGIYRLVEVEPGAAYRFSGIVRARGIVPASEPFNGATFWLAELTEIGPARELFADGAERLIETRHIFPTAAGEEGWQERRLLFRTTPQTRALLVGGLLGLPDEILDGAVDFAELSLHRVSERLYWEQELAAAVAARFAGEPAPADWRGRRLVRAKLGAETRPAIVLLPGEALRLQVLIPSGDARFETGLGPWPPAMVAERGGELALAVKIDGEELARRDVAVPATVEAARWARLELDLARWAGATVTLELTAEGDLPGIFGAPFVRDAAASEVLNLLLVSIDTLRADRVGVYGYDGGTTPHLDAFAAGAILFRHVVTQAPYTLPAHASLFSGQFPIVHGVQRGGDVLSPARSPILARLLGERGYRTRAFTGGGFVGADFGFDQGFDGLTDVDPIRPRDSRYFEIVPDDLVREHGPESIHAWLDEHADEPFFLFVHTYAVHDYDPPEEYLTCRAQGCTSERTDFRDWRLGVRFVQRGRVPLPIPDADRDHLGHLYDAALRYTDDVLADLLRKLDELGLTERTIVAITSDHGEELFERGFVQHGKTVYAEIIDIPMLLRIPGLEPRTVDAPAMLVDLTPTILGALGIPPNPRMQGVDLLRSHPAERVLWSEVDDDFAHKYALRFPSGWKLIHGPLDSDVNFPNAEEWELYELTSDPGELVDRAESDTGTLARLREDLTRRRSALEELSATLRAVGQGELDEDTLTQLRALGYLE